MVRGIQSRIEMASLGSVPPDHLRRFGEVVALGDDLADPLLGHAEDWGDVGDAQVALLDQGDDLG
jgi:hypothetical protein